MKNAFGWFVVVLALSLPVACSDATGPIAGNDGGENDSGGWSCANVGLDIESLARSEARDPEFIHPWLWAPMMNTSQGRYQALLRKLDTQTGRFFDERGCLPGHCLEIDPDAGRMGSNGPDIGRTTAGYSIFFNKAVRQGNRSFIRIYRTTFLGAEPASTGISTSLVTDVGLSVDIQDPLASQVCDSGRMGLIFSEEGRGTVYGMVDEIEDDYARGTRDLVYPRRGKKAWWLPDSFEFVYVGEVRTLGGARSLQVIRVDALSGESRVLTDLAGEEIGSVTPFRVREHGDELMLAVIALGMARNEIVLFRDGGGAYWSEYRRIRLPDEFPFVADLDIIRGAGPRSCASDGPPARFDRTYLTVFSNNKSIAPGHETLAAHTGASIWLLSLDDMVRCRVDSHSDIVKHYDPELLLLRNPDTMTDDLHVVYSEKDEQSTYRQLHVVDTRLRFPYSN